MARTDIGHHLARFLCHLSVPNDDHPAQLSLVAATFCVLFGDRFLVVLGRYRGHPGTVIICLGVYFCETTIGRTKFSCEHGGGHTGKGPGPHVKTVF